MRKTGLMPLDIQFFAGEGEGGEGGNGGDNNDNNQNQNQNQNGDQNQNSGGQDEKTFTQAEMTATATREKKEGKNSILKMFGIKDEKQAKEEAAAFKAWKDSQKTDEQKNQEAQQQLETDKNDALTRATNAENKLAAVMAGVNKDSIDDALAIALLKVTDDKSLDDILGEMKEQAKYKGFFEEGSGNDGDNGTGNGVSHRGDNSNNGSQNIGKRLAEKNLVGHGKKSNYFGK